MNALSEANGGHQAPYGQDDYTARLQDLTARHFGTGAVAFPVFNGTGANVLSLQSALPRWGAVICADTAHLNTDESTAPESVGGLKLLTVPTPDGKLTPELIDRQAWGWDDEHRAQPAVVSISQTTELGTAYTIQEIRTIADHAHAKGMVLHMDGARVANAAAHLGAGLAAFTSEAGVDLLSFGGTKNGLLFGEAIVIPRPAESRVAVMSMPFLRKLNLQLASTQLVALLEGDLWLRSAQHSNAMATLLADSLRGVDGVRITQPVQANAVFAVLDVDIANKLRESFRFYDWNPGLRQVRWMCAFDTTEADVDAFVGELRRLLAQAQGADY
jgi:threonine aldolase